MAEVYNCIDELVGSTPLLRLHATEKALNLQAALMAKLEFFNPGGSVKDRAALYMINEAERKGLLREGSVIIEPTSGNTGIGLACIAASRGYRAIIVMPDSMSVERQKLMCAYGAELVLTPGELGMKGAIEKANALAEEYPHSFIPDQFSNPANALAHEETTGPEIWDATGGVVDIFVAGVGTGGTLTGVGRYLKKQNPNVRIIAVEPAASPLLSGGTAGSHGLMGIGANFIPTLLDQTLIDEVFPVREQQAYTAARELGRREGLLVGISSGAALYAAQEVAKKPENKGKCIVVLLPDTGERYLSTPMFNE